MSRESMNTSTDFFLLDKGDKTFWAALLFEACF